MMTSQFSKPFQYPKKVRDSVESRFDITLIGVYYKGGELVTVRVQKGMSGGYFFSNSPVPSKGQVFVRDTDALVALVSRCINQHTEDSPDCDAVLIGQDFAGICSLLIDAGINIKGAESPNLGPNYSRRW